MNGMPCVATEGKALRPTLCLFACEATGGHARQALPAAVALEFIHNFSLIHDDIQDRDEMRHHRPTLWAQWGLPKALVAGNILRILADKSLDGLVDQGANIELALAVNRLLTEAYLEMIEGQYLDLTYESRPDIGLDDYLSMISKKTGALIRCSFNLGATIGTDDEATVTAFRESGEALGYLFQIRDDVLGIWGDEETTGKPVGADIRRKKNSLPVVYTMSQATGQSMRALMDIYKKESVTDSDVDDVLDIMRRVRAREYAHELATEHRDRALAALESVELDAAARHDIKDLADFLLARDH